MVGALRRLLGYAQARGYGHQPLIELLFNGPLFMEYIAFMVVGRSARRRGAGGAAVRRGRVPKTCPGDRQIEFTSVAEEASAVARLADLAVVHLPAAERAEGEAWVARPRRRPAHAEGVLERGWRKLAAR
jgi:hypothetical protein